MKTKDAILGGIALAVFLTLVSCAFLVPILPPKQATSKGEPWKPDTYAAIASAISAVALVFVASYTVYSAEKVAEKQRLFLEKMEQQKTRPYCDFMIVENTSTKKHRGVYLINYGHGPALKLNWTFTVKGMPIPQKGRMGFELIADIYSLNQGWLERYFPNVIAANTEIAIFRLRDEDENFPAYLGKARDQAIERLVKMIREMDIKLDFKPIMGEPGAIKLHNAHD